MGLRAGSARDAVESLWKKGPKSTRRAAAARSKPRPCVGVLWALRHSLEQAARRAAKKTTPKWSGLVL